MLSRLGYVLLPAEDAFDITSAQKRCRGLWPMLFWGDNVYDRLGVLVCPFRAGY